MYEVYYSLTLIIYNTKYEVFVRVESTLVKFFLQNIPHTRKEVLCTYELYFVRISSLDRVRILITY